MFKGLIVTSLLGCALAANWCCNPPSTRQAMLDVLMKDNNHDGNGYVSLADVKYDLNNNYDTDPKDGTVTLYEWVKRWNCRYGDSYEYAEWVFKLLTGGKDTMDISAFKFQANPGIPLAAFRATNLQRYTTYANSLKT